MFHKSKRNLKLLGRSEGKLKSFESCVDVRAWSHDIDVRNSYLRDWIKCDMPVCIVPISAVTSLLRTMTWRRRCKVAPRCHPECKSKVVLDSICNSCHAIKECLRNEQVFDKYFVEEELETTHWPCEQCLEALKAIKMFWKIILEKIFGMDTTKSEFRPCGSNESIKTVAQVWQNEIIEKALIVRSLTPFLHNQDSNSSWYYKIKEIHSSKNCTSRRDVGTEIDYSLYKPSQSKLSTKQYKKLSQYTSTKIETVNANCNTCSSQESLYRNKKIEYLKQRYDQQNEELRILKRENLSLRLELETMSKKPFNSYRPLNIYDSNKIEAPTPFECCCENDNNMVKDIESEMIITLKNCKNTNFKHVSMLQVLHKTNTTMKNSGMSSSHCKKNEDPIKVLSKVQDTFKEIVERELNYASRRKRHRKNININSSYHDMPHSAKSSHSTISDSVFMSTTDVL